MLGDLRFFHRAWRYRLVLEARQIRFLRKQLRAGDVAVDVGAHKGAYTYWMRRAVSPNGRVFAFEPQPRLAKKLRERTVPKPGRADVTVENLALSSETGPRELYIPSGGDSPGATLHHPATESASAHPVVCDTLDSYFERAGVQDIRLIKCDVEGHELDVFRGGERLLRRDRPHLLFECELRHRLDGRIDVVFAYLRYLGYTGWFNDAKRWRSVEEFEPGRFQQVGRRPYVNNFVFIHPARAEPQACL